MSARRRIHPIYFLSWILLITLSSSLFGPMPVALAQTPVPLSKIQAVLNVMSPEERVGQLFLVTFRGTDVSDESQIRDLISNHHVGGVVLQAENDNFIAQQDTIPAAHQLINALQEIESETTTEVSENTYVPLFVGISQEGDGAPNDQILSGLSSMPNAMAIGATWNTELARQMGTVLGSELSALGFNLFLGPSLDVVEAPNPSAQIDLGTRVFGGDPFWVGEMGRAYIAGLHAGSSPNMMVVAKHFPGRGSSDRVPEEEIATVRKPLEQLRLVELAPFFEVTNSTEPANLVDGLLVSHIRYQGFQGNIRATTRPVSFDPTALLAILDLPEFTAWRDNGGLMVSDALGSQAVRDFYSQGGETFSPRFVAQDAFLAGNDLLYLGNIASAETGSDTYSTTVGILQYFAQVYQSDPTFARRVDEAVTRILAQKFRIYDLFTFSNVLTSAERLDSLGSSEQLAFEVARNAATLISPDPQELNTLLPAPPNQNDRIAFLTDTSSYKQCAGCLLYDELAADSLQRAVLRLYGPNGSAQVFTSRLSSFPFTELELMLNGESTTDIESVLANSNWIVISLADVRNNQISLLRRFFAERPNLLNKNIILFSFTAPYYLDATDISKLTAYYALYSKQPAFVDVAARLLFQQASPAGDSPVSIPAIEYDLITQTSPDPEQVISLSLAEAVSPTPTSEATPATPETPEPTPIPLYSIGDTIAIRAGPIVDHNQNIVPDGTVVRFTMSNRDESGLILQQIDSTTTKGIAFASFPINMPGKVEIRAMSEPAVISDALQFDSSTEPVQVTFVPVASATPTVTVLPTVTTTPINDLISPEGYPRVGAWLLVLLAVFGGAMLVFWAVSQLVSTRWGLRWALCVLLGGLLAYNYLALGFPRAAEWIASGAGAYGVLLLTLIGETIGALAAWVWMKVISEPASQGG